MARLPRTLTVPARIETRWAAGRRLFLTSAALLAVVGAIGQGLGWATLIGDMAPVHSVHPSPPDVRPTGPRSPWPPRRELRGLRRHRRREDLRLALRGAGPSVVLANACTTASELPGVTCRSATPRRS